jgi:phosphotransferase system HPr-like phosphotransfer protein
MNKKVTVNLNAIQKVKDFVNIIDKFESDVDIEQGKYVINAKSIMAIFSLNLLEPMVVKIDSENEEEIKSFNRVMEEFKYEDNL